MQISTSRNIVICTEHGVLRKVDAKSHKLSPSIVYCLDTPGVRGGVMDAPCQRYGRRVASMVVHAVCDCLLVLDRSAIVLSFCIYDVMS